MSKNILSPMHTIYVGDSKNVINRIRFDHFKGNVEASALRKAIAEYKNYPLAKERRHSGSIRLRIDLPDPRIGEREISAYLQSGIWKYILCESYDIAHDFQWFVIDRLNPLLNKYHKEWNVKNGVQYSKLFQELVDVEGYNFTKLANHLTGPGVYVLYHEDKPEP